MRCMSLFSFHAVPSAELTDNPWYNEIQLFNVPETLGMVQNNCPAAPVLYPIKFEHSVLLTSREVYRRTVSGKFRGRFRKFFEYLAGFIRVNLRPFGTLRSIELIACCLI